MKKYIFIPNEVLERLRTGKAIEGTIKMDLMTRSIKFNAFNRKSREHQKDELVKKLPWGWVKESAMRLKVFGSFPKDLGTARVMGLLDGHAKDAKDALIERELIETV